MHAPNPSLDRMPSTFIVPCRKSHPVITAPLPGKLAPHTGTDVFCADAANHCKTTLERSPVAAAHMRVMFKNDHCCRRVSLGITHALGSTCPTRFTKRLTMSLTRVTSLGHVVRLLPNDFPHSLEPFVVAVWDIWNSGLRLGLMDHKSPSLLSAIDVTTMVLHGDVFHNLCGRFCVGANPIRCPHSFGRCRNCGRLDMGRTSSGSLVETANRPSLPHCATFSLPEWTLLNLLRRG